MAQWSFKSLIRLDRGRQLRRGILTLFVITVFVMLSACSMDTDKKPAQDRPLPEKFKMPEAVPLNGRSIPLEDLKPRDTIESLLKRRRPSLDLSGLEHYAVKATRSDLMLLAGEDGKFITNLNLGGSRLSDTEIEPIAKLNLRTLTLRGCAVKDLHAIATMNSLVHLDLSGCAISSEGMKVISSLHNLKTLELIKSKIKDSDLKPLVKLENLEKLNLNGCQNLTPAAVQALKTKMQKCDISFRAGAKDEKKDGIEVLRRVEASLINQHEYEEADLSVQKLLSKWEKEPEGKYEYIARAYQLRAQCLYKIDRTIEATEMQKKAIAVYADHLHDNEAICKLGTNLATELERDNKVSDGLKLRLQTDDFWKHHPPTGSARGEYVENLAAIGHDMIDLNRISEAKAWLKKSFDASAKMARPSPRAEASCLLYMAHLDFNEGHIETAITRVTKSLSLFDRDDAPNKFNDACYLQARCFNSMKQYAAAEKSLKVALNQRLAGSRLERINELLAQVLQAQGKTEEAKGLSAPETQ